MNEIQLKNLSPVVLAYIGDAVHTLFVRQSILILGELVIDKYNKICSKYCSAVWQAKVLDNIFEILTDEEKDIIRRGRNYKTNNVAKNATLQEYKKATSLECLIGFLHLTEQKERLNQILALSIKGENKWLFQEKTVFMKR